jgi:hypothetical protein
MGGLVATCGSRCVSCCVAFVVGWGRVTRPPHGFAPVFVGRAPGPTQSTVAGGARVSAAAPRSRLGLRSPSGGGHRVAGLVVARYPGLAVDGRRCSAIDPRRLWCVGRRWPAGSTGHCLLRAGRRPRAATGARRFGLLRRMAKYAPHTVHFSSLARRRAALRGAGHRGVQSLRRAVTLGLSSVAHRQARRGVDSVDGHSGGKRCPPPPTRATPAARDAKATQTLRRVVTVAAIAVANHTGRQASGEYVTREVSFSPLARGRPLAPRGATGSASPRCPASRSATNARGVCALSVVWQPLERTPPTNARERTTRPRAPAAGRRDGDSPRSRSALVVGGRQGTEGKRSRGRLVTNRGSAVAAAPEPWGAGRLIPLCGRFLSPPPTRGRDMCRRPSSRAGVDSEPLAMRHKR